MVRIIMISFLRQPRLSLIACFFLIATLHFGLLIQQDIKNVFLHSDFVKKLYMEHRQVLLLKLSLLWYAITPFLIWFETISSHLVWLIQLNSSEVQHDPKYNRPFSFKSSYSSGQCIYFIFLLVRRAQSSNSCPTSMQWKKVPKASPLQNNQTFSPFELKAPCFLRQKFFLLSKRQKKGHKDNCPSNLFMLLAHKGTIPTKEFSLINKGRASVTPNSAKIKSYNPQIQCN